MEHLWIEIIIIFFNSFYNGGPNLKKHMVPVSVALAVSRTTECLKCLIQLSKM